MQTKLVEVCNDINQHHDDDDDDDFLRASNGDAYVRYFCRAQSGPIRDSLVLVDY